ncbi:two-component system sensor histidine kinase NtrB [Thermosulfurimonas dismutans]|uniref:two-component system sensor histidine kinase NtrB n=1 Tax=Thermosulfurimonas dismutans TaxID=999894 RepID=UPI00137AEC0C|nr:ATP-binding protein [Thermosulfurimonas dismutans]
MSYNDWLSFFLYVGALGLISYLALKLSELREEITQKEDIQRYLLSSLSAGLLFLDPNLKVLSWNPRAREILGKIARGQSLKEILGQDISTEVSRGETNLGKRILGYSIFPLRREKEILGWGFLFQDITELKKKERRLREAEKLASLGTMAAGLIHEIKNPLASISGGVQFLKENLGSSGELGQVLEVISRETERLNRLVTNFLFFARPERGEKERFNLKDLLREILDTNQPLFSQVKMKARVPSVEIEANKEQWRQILENLLINAVEASREVQRSEVEIEVELLDRDYLIKVRDYGSGIKEDIRSRIFEPFFTTKPTGTGLGLAVVYRIVENLKGEVKLFSKEGEGTLFEIKLPR